MRLDWFLLTFSAVSAKKITETDCEAAQNFDEAAKDFAKTTTHNAIDFNEKIKFGHVFKH